MCSEKLNDRLRECGLKTKIYFESYTGVAERVKEFLPCGKLLLLADEEHAAFMERLRGLFGGFRVLCVLYGKTDGTVGLFSLPDDVRGVVAAGRRSAEAARFFCTLRGAYCFILPFEPSARGLFEKESERDRYPVREPDGILLDETLVAPAKAGALAEAALSAVFADDADIDAAFTGERKAEGYELLRAAEKECAAAESGRDVFAASAACFLALRGFRDYPALFFCRICGKKRRAADGEISLAALRLYAARYRLLFEKGRLRPYYVADYLSRLERAARVWGAEAYKRIRIPSSEECFARAEIFAETREHFSVAEGLTFDFSGKIQEKYFLWGGKKGDLPVQGAEELFAVSADLSPLFSAGALERDFGARLCAAPQKKEKTPVQAGAR